MLLTCLLSWAEVTFLNNHKIYTYTIKKIYNLLSIYLLCTYYNYLLF